MDIQSTKEYDIFTVHRNHPNYGRRPDVARIERFAAMIKKVGFIPAYHITVTSKMEIMDGQLRLEAAKRAGVEITFVVNDNLFQGCMGLVDSEIKVAESYKAFFKRKR